MAEPAIDENDERFFADEEVLLDRGEEEEEVPNLYEADEDAEEADEVAEEEGEEEEVDEVSQLRQQLEELQREKHGLLNDLVAKRRENAETKELRERMKELLAKQAKSEEPELPDPESQPVEYLQSAIDRRFGEIGGELGEVKKFAEEQRQQAAMGQLLGAINQQVASAVGDDESKAAEFVSARDHAFRALTETFRASGVDNAEQQAYQSGMAMVVQAMQRGENPVEFVRGYAQRIGWQPPKAEAASEQKEQRPSIPAKPRSVRTLSKSGGSAKGKVIRPTDDIPDAVMDKLLEPQNESLWARLMSGEQISADQIA